MSESQNEKSKRINTRFIIDKVISWQFITLLVFLILLSPIRELLRKTEEIKFGDFQLTVTEIANSLGVANIIKDINDLTYDELKLFLIIGGEDANYYIFTANNIPHNKLSKMYDKLTCMGLIEQVDPKTIEGYEKMNIHGGFGIKTTLKGEKVHRAIIDAIYINLVEKGEDNT